jgi:hypothetical protein
LLGHVAFASRPLDADESVAICDPAGVDWIGVGVGIGGLYGLYELGISGIVQLLAGEKKGGNPARACPRSRLYGTRSENPVVDIGGHVLRHGGHRSLLFLLCFASD